MPLNQPNEDAPAITDLSVRFVQNINRSYRNLRNLNLSYNEIPDASNLRLLQTLKTLNLSHNRLNSISNIALRNLVELDVSFNALFYIDELKGAQLPQLITLDLSHNHLTTPRAVAALRNLPNLQRLSLQGNPLTSRADYRYIIIRTLPTLTHLDGRRITDHERAAANDTGVDGEETHNVLDASSVSLQALNGHMHHSLDDASSSDDAEGYGVEDGSFSNDRASQVISKTRRLLREAESRRLEIARTAQRFSTRTRPTPQLPRPLQESAAATAENGLGDDVDDHSVPDSPGPDSTLGQQPQAGKHAGAVKLRAAVRGLIASRHFGAAQPELPPMWNASDGETTDEDEGEDGSEDEDSQNGAASHGNTATHHPQRSDERHQRQSSPHTTFGISHTRRSGMQLSTDRRIAALEAQIIAERAEADQLRKYFERQAVESYNGSVLHQKKSEDLKQQQQRDAATILELTKRADGLQRQLGAQEKVMRIQEEALQKAIWRQQVFALFVQQESSALQTEDSNAQFESKAAELEKLVHAATSNNDVLESKLEAKDAEIERMKEEINRLQQTASQARGDAEQTIGRRQQAMSAVRSGLLAMKKVMEVQEGRVSGAFRTLLVLDQRVGFAASRVRMLASVLQARLRSAGLNRHSGGLHSVAIDKPISDVRKIQQQMVPADIDQHLNALDVGNIDPSAAAAIASELRSLRRERKFLLNAIQEVQDKHEATTRAAQELGGAAQAAIERETAKRRAAEERVTALKSELRNSERNIVIRAEKMESDMSRERELLREQLSDQDKALKAAREENSALRKAEAKQLFLSRQIERDLDREKQEREEQEHELQERIDALRQSLVMTRRQLGEIKRDRSNLLAAMRDSDRLPQPKSAEPPRGRSTRLRARRPGDHTVAASVTTMDNRELHERLTGLMQLSSSILNDDDDVNDGEFDDAAADHSSGSDEDGPGTDAGSWPSTN